nr:putative reverse transcriptase domain-containing protein [Tanacetum cinerariifolium]
SQIKDRLKAARDHQKSYADKRRKPLEFSVGDYVLLKVSLWKGVVRFGKKGKLASRFVGPFEIVKKVGLVAYRLDFPEEFNDVHDTFHVSNLKKCLTDPTLQVPLDEIQVDAKLNFMEEHVEILEREFRKLKQSRIAIVKVRWNSKRGPEFTWEREDRMKLKYLHLFSDILHRVDGGFWKAKETTFPVLSRMAMDILSVQATSVASESTFSTSGRVLSIRRTRLTLASLEMCMCLKDHLDAQERKQDKSTIETPVDFEEEILDAEVQANEAIPLSDEKIALDAASSEGSMSGPSSGGEEAEGEVNYGYDVYHDDY